MGKVCLGTASCWQGDSNSQPPAKQLWPQQLCSNQLLLLWRKQEVRQTSRPRSPTAPTCLMNSSHYFHCNQMLFLKKSSQVHSLFFLVHLEGNRLFGFKVSSQIIFSFCHVLLYVGGISLKWYKSSWWNLTAVCMHLPASSWRNITPVHQSRVYVPVWMFLLLAAGEQAADQMLTPQWGHEVMLPRPWRSLPMRSDGYLTYRIITRSLWSETSTVAETKSSVSWQAEENLPPRHLKL